MWIQGLPEQGTDKVEEKILALCNGALELQPPLQLEDIEVAHRLPRPADRTPKQPASQEQPKLGSGVSSSDAAPRPPRTVIIKFVSRRIKSNVMELRISSRT